MNEDKGERFKIDIDDFKGRWPALFVRRIKRSFWLKSTQVWVQVDDCTSVDDCRKIYERIKDLPEYLP